MLFLRQFAVLWFNYTIATAPYCVIVLLGWMLYYDTLSQRYCPRVTLQVHVALRHLKLRTWQTFHSWVSSKRWWRLTNEIAAIPLYQIFSMTACRMTIHRCHLYGMYLFLSSTSAAVQVLFWSLLLEHLDMVKEEPNEPVVDHSPKGSESIKWWRFTT